MSGCGSERTHSHDVLALQLEHAHDLDGGVGADGCEQWRQLVLLTDGLVGQLLTDGVFCNTA